MKAIFIMLLVAALGAGIYFLVTKDKEHSVSSKELIIGKWKIDSLDISRTKDSSVGMFALALAVADSNLYNYEFDFTKNGLIAGHLNGKAGDTSFYKIENEKQLLVWTNKDSVKTRMDITKLDSAKLVMQTKDSIVYMLSKVK